MPTVSKFLASLDRDKQDRDRQLDEARKPDGNQNLGEATAHRNEPQGDASARKTVTDPTTGNTVQIEDVNEGFVKLAKDPTVWRTPYSLGSIRLLTYLLAYCP